MYCQNCGSANLQSRVVDLDGTNLVDRLICQKCGQHHPEGMAFNSHYTLTASDIIAITKICNARFVGVANCKHPAIKLQTRRF
jgi:uncharacterized Zn finger protein